MTARPLLGVPLLGGMAEGILGIPGLPRLWQKGMLESAGARSAACAYPDATERRMLDALSIPFPAFADFVMQRPEYLATEAWVAKSAGGPVRWDGPDVEVARQENLHDLDALHAFASVYSGTRDVPLAPAVSGNLAGSLELLHLPRLWAKATVDRMGLLPDGYNSGKGPLDEQLAVAIGVDLAEVIHYIHGDRPAYGDFEVWIGRRARALDAATREAWNLRITESLKPEFVAAPEREMLGISDPLERRGMLLNHLVDAHYFRREIVAT